MPLPFAVLRRSWLYAWTHPALPSTMFSAQAWGEQGGCWEDEFWGLTLTKRRKVMHFFFFLFLFWKSCNSPKGAKETWDVVQLGPWKCFLHWWLSPHHGRLQAYVHFHTSLRLLFKLVPIPCWAVIYYSISFHIYNNLCNRDSSHYIDAAAVVQRG